MIKEGRWLVAVFSLLTIICYIISFYVKIILFLTIVFGVIALLLINFFRDPERKILKNHDVLFSPADGKIFDIIETETTYCVKIFMSILNVHVQRSPIEGIIKKIEYKRGKFLPAGKDKTDNFNERNIIEIENKQKEKFIVTQIAGILARRIICWVKEYQSVSQNQKIGAILLGSQVNFEFPKNGYKILVKKNQKVYAGISPIALKLSSRKKDELEN